MAFRQAAPVALRARISIEGLSGAGKTTTALRIAQGLVAGSDKRIAGICTEQGRMQLESRWCDFDISILEPHQLGPEDLAREIVASYGHGVLVIDSMSAAWAAILQIKDATTSAKEAYTGWGKINPRLEKLTHAILKHPGHVIACFRSKMKHEIVEQNGKKEVRKLGVEPIARPGAEYDFDLSIELDHQHVATLAKPARGLYAEAFPEHWRCERPGVEVGETIRRCLEGDQPTPCAAARVNDGPAASAPPVSTRAASSEPSNGGAPLHVPDPLHDSPEARDRMLREIRRLIKEIGADHCKEVIAPLGLPPVAQANAHELNRIVTALLAEGTRLDCLSVFQWKALAKEIGPDAAGAIATQVSTEPGQAPEDWDWHQLDRAIKAAKKLTAGGEA